MSLNTAFTTELQANLDQLQVDRVYKSLNYLSSPQAARVQMEGRGEVLILSSNNYLGLCDEPSVVPAPNARSPSMPACTTLGSTGCERLAPAPGRSASSAAPSPSTASWRRRSRGSWAPRRR